MYDWAQKHKKRREVKWQAIRQGRAPRSWAAKRKEWDPGQDLLSYDASPWNQTSGKGQARGKKGGRLRTQMLLTAALFILTLLVFRSQSPVLKPAEQWISGVMTHDFQFAGMENWFKRYLGGSPSILPAFSRSETDEKPREHRWHSPVFGKVVLPFDEQRKGIVIRTVAHARVAAADEGWVIFAGEKPGLGKTVIIQHEGGSETWYGQLAGIDVKPKDWVKKGQTIGSISETKGQPLLYFAVKQNDRFIDPASVIVFD
ncbi:MULTISPECIES: M23 family metallopeptidase [Thermoactinomyces]|jgi:stage IV sporulation protein FA|uniref:M23 family metallopeptidase n=1 Tax=Thermoactinomyces daqus TaxID=1329516 RepID=A0A7W1X7B5_9BACL|nr:MULTISPECIES: M23 family metallopeptidase [Thermoactinomyces]MBA4541385.1 M23 family metallopeptidase [Thermoactinomyces daqus]MBH8596858.1 M23 family metallopeptidase [Thermoactinomyces sp. CICC 10523]MBH8603618.1 M23 family metallopeptidase [Thermoactinomyces sp. CICC 10522]MBH8606783.1 M23 family metallopeptidase [Thermoactinomyces sp. CICC 10521]